MAKFSHKVMGKEVGDAKVYAAPHTGSKAGVDISSTGYGKQSKKGGAEDLNVSVGNINRHGFTEPKTSGIKTRGNGAAKRGVTARGPMA